MYSAATSTGSYSLLTILNNILGVFGLSGTVEKVQTGTPVLVQNFDYVIVNLFARFAVFSAFFSGAMIVLVAIYIHRFHVERRKIMEKILPPEGAGAEAIAEEGANQKWQLVIDHVNSLDENKWKFAILEADIMLDDLLNRLDLPGDTIGDKLKAAEPSDFLSIESAWEAHKIRNAIAHEGSDFLINQREAKRVIGLYQKVFEEFEII